MKTKTTQREYYTYRYIDPNNLEPPFHTKTRRTYGTFVRMTGPMGIPNVPYAIFRTRCGELLIPEYDLTSETKAAIAKAEKGD